MIKRIAKTYSLYMILASYLTFFKTFLIAYSTQSKTTLVNINTLGEAHLELVLLLASIPGVLIYLWQWFFQSCEDVSEVVP